MEAEDPIIIITVPPGRHSMTIAEADAIGQAGDARWFYSKEEAIAYLQSLE